MDEYSVLTMLLNTPVEGEIPLTLWQLGVIFLIALFLALWSSIGQRGR